MSDISHLGHIDQYELLRELGGGGFGCVYLARDRVSNIDVAVKGLPPLVRNNKDELENIKRNFALVSRLHHPNIAAALTLHPAVDVVYADKSDADKLRVFKGDTLIVMQYAPGVTLSKWAKSFPGGMVPIEKAVEITSDIANALDYAHAEKILHRDIKPENVMIDVGKDSCTSVRVLDFGLAAEIHSSVSRVSNDISDTSGTRPYMAPEQWLGSNQGHQTDQYSLAALFHELVTGKVPFASAFETGDPLVMFGAVSRKEAEIPSWLPGTVRRALSKALSKKRENRFASCSEFADALRNGVKSNITPTKVVAGVSICALIVASAVIYRLGNNRPPVDAAGNPENISASVTQTTQTSVSTNLPARSSVANTEPVSDFLADAPDSAIKTQPVPKVTRPDPSVQIPKAVTESPPRIETPSAKLPPELRIVAVFEGNEIEGARIQTMNGTFELPYKWEGVIANRRQLGPYKVTYEKGQEYLTGEFKIESIDWSGLKTVKVELKRSDRPSKGGIQGWVF